MSSERNRVPLAQCATAAEAEMIVELLRREGIEAVMSGSYDPLLTTGLQPVIVYVSEADQTEAHRLYLAFFGRHLHDSDDSQQEETL